MADVLQLDEISQLFLEANKLDMDEAAIVQQCYSAAYAAKVLVR